MNIYSTLSLILTGLIYFNSFYTKHYHGSLDEGTNQRSFYPKVAPSDSTTVDWENDSTYILNYTLKDIKFKNSYEGPISMGQINKSNLVEISGIVEGVSNSNVLWGHNDSGGKPAIYALDKSNGSYLGSVFLRGGKNKDWEDIAMGFGSENGKGHIYIGDIGDNSAVRPFLKIYRIAEPVVGDEVFKKIEIIPEVIKYDYPEGPRDAEAMLVDPISKDIIVITKREAYVHVYCLPFEQLNQGKVSAKLLGKLPFRNVVAADISSDGYHVLVKTYEAVYHWDRRGNEHLKYTFSRCPESLSYVSEVQGESIAWSNEKGGYFTLSEASDSLPDLYYYNTNK